MFIQMSDNMLSKVAGQVVEGWIHVHLQSPMFNSQGLVLALKGNERVWMRKKHTKRVGVVSAGQNKKRRTVTYYQNHSGFSPIIDVTFPVTAAGVLPPGMHSFPFCIQLPEWLPGSMALATVHEKARHGVEYRLVAQFTPIEQ